MKRSTIILSSIMMMTALAGYSQTSGGQGGTGQGTTQPNPANPPGQTLPPGLEKREQLPPGLQGREQLPPGLATRTNQTGRPPPRNGLPGTGALTNDFGAGTNRLGNTNAFASVTNQNNLQQTSRPGETNRVFSVTNSTPIFQDQAFTPADARLLTQIRQAVVGQIRTVGVLSPVHFIVRDGVVTLVGVLPRDEERQRLVTIVQGVPGVVRVIDQIQVGGGAGAQTTTGVGAGVQPTTGVGVNSGLTNQFGGRAGTFGTNFPPTSRTNAPNRIFGTNLPP